MKTEKMFETFNSLLKQRAVSADAKDKMISLSESIIENFSKIKEIKEVIKYDLEQFEKIVEQEKKDALNISFLENPEFEKKLKLVKN